jgi:hypothetical protein
LRREHDDESGDARHDGASQRHGRRGNARRIASIAIWLLTGKLASRRPRAIGRCVRSMHSTAAVSRIDVASRALDPRTTALVLIDLQKGIASMPQATASSGTPILKPYLMVRPAFRAYVFPQAAPPRLPPEAVFRWPQSGRRTPRLMPPSEAGGAVRLFWRGTQFPGEILGIFR